MLALYMSLSNLAEQNVLKQTITIAQKVEVECASLKDRTRYRVKFSYSCEKAIPHSNQLFFPLRGVNRFSDRRIWP